MIVLSVPLICHNAALYSTYFILTGRNRVILRARGMPRKCSGVQIWRHICAYRLIAGNLAWTVPLG